MKSIKRSWMTLVVLVPTISLSQTLSIGAGGGSLFVLKSSFYTDPLGYPGLYYVNGVRSMFRGQGLGTEFQLAGIAELKFAEFPATISVGIDYAFLRGHGSTVLFYLPPATGSYPAEGTTKVDLVSGSLGTNFYLVRGPISPFLNLHVQWNHFGESSVRFDNAGDWSEAKALDAYNRFGAGVGPGIDFSLLPGTVARLTALYNV